MYINGSLFTKLTPEADTETYQINDISLPGDISTNCCFSWFVRAHNKFQYYNSENVVLNVGATTINDEQLFDNLAWVDYTQSVVPNGYLGIPGDSNDGLQNDWPQENRITQEPGVILDITRNSIYVFSLLYIFNNSINLPSYQRLRDEGKMNAFYRYQIDIFGNLISNGEMFLYQAPSPYDYINPAVGWPLQLLGYESNIKVVNGICYFFPTVGSIYTFSLDYPSSGFSSVVAASSINLKVEENINTIVPNSEGISVLFAGGFQNQSQTYSVTGFGSANSPTTPIYTELSNSSFPTFAVKGSSPQTLRSLQATYDPFTNNVFAYGGLKCEDNIVDCVSGEFLFFDFAASKWKILLVDNGDNTPIPPLQEVNIHFIYPNYLLLFQGWRQQNSPHWLETVLPEYLPFYFYKIVPESTDVDGTVQPLQLRNITPQTFNDSTIVNAIPGLDSLRRSVYDQYWDETGSDLGNSVYDCRSGTIYYFFGQYLWLLTGLPRCCANVACCIE